LQSSDNREVEALRIIDELAANAWPAPVVQRADGWLLRYGWGVTRRANSALPSSTEPCDFAVRVGATLRAYRGWDAPARVQITEGLVPGLEDHLRDLGWSTEGACDIMVADISQVIARTPDDEIELQPTPDASWIGCWWGAGRGGAPSQGAEYILGLPLPRVAHARRTSGGEWACVGRGVCERGWLGIFALATRPDVVGRGHGSAVVGALARWAARDGADRAYLQVEIDNERARRLFGHLGFSRIGGYHYRTLGAQ
jgi:N-acetylglutamate synthase